MPLLLDERFHNCCGQLFLPLRPVLFLQPTGCPLQHYVSVLLHDWPVPVVLWHWPVLLSTVVVYWWPIQSVPVQPVVLDPVIHPLSAPPRDHQVAPDPLPCPAAQALRH